MTNRTVVAAARAPVVATAEWSGSVAVWDLDADVCRARFDTVFDGGGPRLAVRPDGKRVYAGSYYQGIAAHRTTDGRRLWYRDDVRHIQHVTCSRDGRSLYVGREPGDCLVLEASSGSDVSRHAGVRGVFTSPSSDAVLLDRARPEIRSSWDARRGARVERTSFAVLDVAFGHTSLAITESGQGVRCFALDGRLRWSFSPPENVHALRLGYAGGRFLGVLWAYRGGGPMSVLSWLEPTGEPDRVIELGTRVDTTFGSHGLVTANGEIVDVGARRIVRTLGFGGA